MLAALLAITVPALAVAQDAVESAEPAPGRIVYTRQHEADFDMWLSNPDGTDEQRLVEFEESAAGEDHPRWSPDGTRIVFAATDSAQQISLYVVDYRGGDVSVVAEKIGIRGGEPVWSPDGDCIAYSGRHEGVLPTATDIYVRCLDDTEARVLTDSLETDERMPYWSPDGSTIWFAARPSGDAGRKDHWALHAVDMDGSNRRDVIASEHFSVRFPRVSPDGSQLAFIASPSANEGFDFGTLYISSVDGSDYRPLINKPAGPFSWSPDGTELLFNNIANEGISLVDSLLAIETGDLVLSNGLHATMQDAQAKGLYRIEVTSREVSRLQGKAGGVIATPDAYDFGYAPDWTAGTYTPTPTATNTPTPTLTPTVTSTPRAGEPTPTSGTSGPGDRNPDGPIYLPVLIRNFVTIETATPTASSPPEASATPDDPGTPTEAVTDTP